MQQLDLFHEVDVKEIKRQVLSEFTRVPGETYEEWEEFIQVEITYRIKEACANRPHPNYKPQLIKK